jgi:hypothetical protein
MLNLVSWESHATKVHDATIIATNWALARPEIRQLGTAKNSDVVRSSVYQRDTAAITTTIIAMRV